MDGYYSDEELREIGFKTLGKNVLVSRKASIYTPETISIAHDVRIDDFCFLVGAITIESFIHLAPYSSIHGTGGGSVTLKDFTALSAYSTIYAGSDDYSGEEFYFYYYYFYNQEFSNKKKIRHFHHTYKKGEYHLFLLNQ